MRVIWKDSKPKEYKPIKYRNHYIFGSPEGWEITIPGDNNLYASHYCAANAIDKALGGTGVRGQRNKKRQSYGIKIIGKVKKKA